MYINTDFNIEGDTSMLRHFDGVDGVSVYINGFVFDLDGKTDAELIPKLSTLIFEKYNDFPFDELFGNYIIFIVSKASSLAYLFGDNSGMCKPYISSKICGNSFLEVSEQLPLESKTLNSEAILDILNFNCVYDHNTPVTEISRLPREDVLKISSQGFHRISKLLTPISQNPTGNTPLTLDALFGALKIATTKRKVSIDLTGGQDSRLITLAAHYHDFTFEAACSGNENAIDMNIGENVAKQLGIKYEKTIYKSQPALVTEFDEVLQTTDGNVEVVWFHRIIALSKARLKRGIDLQLMGGGGELYRDYGWTQDFPFIWSRKSKLLKYYTLRMEGYKFPKNILHDSLLDKSTNSRYRMLRNMENFVCSKNTLTYDNIYYNISCQAYVAQALTARTFFIDAYNPLVEPELVRTAFNLPRRKRLFSLWHRRRISEYSLDTSLIKTDRGTTCSAKPIDILLEIIPAVMKNYVTTIKQFGKNILSEKYKNSEYSNNKYLSEFKTNGELDAVIEHLKEVNILQNNCSSADIPDRLIGRLITLSIVIKNSVTPK